MTTTTLEVYTPERQREIATLLGLEGPPNQIALLFQLAEHYHLDPLTKEIALIPKKGPFIGVWGRLHIGHRSGLLDGFEADDEWETESGLYCVRCILWRRDMSHPAAKVIGRVGRHERKDWPFEIARARAVRAAFGYAFNIHDAYDSQDDSEAWVPPPEERVEASVIPESKDETVPPARVDADTGEMQAETSGPKDAGEPPTRVVGGHSLAERLAMAARDAGIEDDETRHDVVRAATGGKATRGLDVTEAQAPRLFQAFAELEAGTVELRYDAAGKPSLVRPRRRRNWTGEEREEGIPTE